MSTLLYLPMQPPPASSYGLRVSWFFRLSIFFFKHTCWMISNTFYSRRPLFPLQHLMYMLRHFCNWSGRTYFFLQITFQCIDLGNSPFSFFNRSYKMYLHRTPNLTCIQRPSEFGVWMIATVIKPSCSWGGAIWLIWLWFFLRLPEVPFSYRPCSIKSDWDSYSSRGWFSIDSWVWTVYLNGATGPSMLNSSWQTINEKSLKREIF